MIACDIATTSFVGPGNLLLGALLYSILMTKILSLFARVAQNSSSNWASHRAWPPPCRSRYTGSCSQGLRDCGIKTRFRRWGRQGYVLRKDGRIPFGAGLRVLMMANPARSTIFRDQSFKK
jgi:hypothetical protein